MRQVFRCIFRCIVPCLFRSLLCLALAIGIASVQGCFTDSGEGAGTAQGTPEVTPGKIPETPNAHPESTGTVPQHQDSAGTPARPNAILELQDAGTWRSRLIRDSSEIPVNGFKAFYFEDSTDMARLDSERVAFPALSYAYTGPGGVPAQRFDAYWIGRFEFAEDTAWRIDLSQSNSVARILIDDREIYTGEGSLSLIHAFAKGSHLIEIEYKNDWHTISFSVLFAPAVVDKPAGALDTAATGAEYWYASVNESGKSDLGLDVSLKPSAKPVILFLSSYRVVRWNIVPADSAQVLAVFVDSYEPQSTVTGLRASVPVTFRKGIPMAYRLMPDCYPQTGYCNDNGFLKLARYMGDEFKISLTGYTGDYNPASLSVPELILDSAEYRDIEDRTKALIESSRLRGLEDVFPGDTAATWQAHYLPSEADIPVGRFQAFYFSDRNPATVLHSEAAAAPAMKYSWSEFHGLDANDFAGYWIGKFAFSAPTTLAFGISQSHAQTAIYVDKRQILAGPGEDSATCSVSAGTHLIEIQHVNNWHTIDFAVTLEPR
jgi:hypothetical protein